MGADIYTKYFSDSDVWDRLRMLINLYKPGEIADLIVNPDNQWYDEKYGKPDFQRLFDGKIGKTFGGIFGETSDGGFSLSTKCLNKQFFYIMEGLGTADGDFRQPVKVKPQKQKTKPKTQMRPAPGPAAPSGSGVAQSVALSGGGANNHNSKIPCVSVTTSDRDAAPSGSVPEPKVVNEVAFY